MALADGALVDRVFFQKELVARRLAVIKNLLVPVVTFYDTGSKDLDDE